MDKRVNVEIFVQLEMPHDSLLHELVDNLILTKIAQRVVKVSWLGKGCKRRGCRAEDAQSLTSSFL
jgi:hypothetical protein